VNRLSSLVGTALVAALVASGTIVASGAAAEGDTPVAQQAQAGDRVLFVHGYGYDKGTPEGKNCGNTWGNALDYFERRGWNRGSMKTVGYYTGDENCDVTIGGGATTGTPIKNLAADLAKHIHQYNTSTGKPVDIVAHSMGGLITRVALLGSAKGWAGFPPDALEVGDVVTLGTPHQGVIEEAQLDDTQWQSMNYPESDFMQALHAPENRLSGANWAAEVDWSFVGANEDGTVSETSAIDEGNHADHKYRYLDGNEHKVTHSGLRQWYSGDYRLRYWNASDGQSHDTTNGWAPLETAYNAIARNNER
jgi:pimeloyl-ACP methyl ester carboxylesterase